MRTAEPYVPKPMPGPAAPVLPASPPRDHFTWRPWTWALLLWVVAVLVPVLSSGLNDLLLVLWGLVVSIPALSAAPGVALIFLLVNLFRRRWRAATSIVLASAAFAFAALVSLSFSQELRWYVWRSHYMAQIEMLPRVPGEVRSIWWDGGMGWDVRLEYHESEAEARARQGMGECKRALKQLAPHYFLSGFYC